MNLLIVDDDLLALQGISQMIPKEPLGIKQIFCARRVQEAKTLFQTQTVDLLLCDIEMPMENGLELLEWLHAKNVPVVTMVLTSHADFSYSTRAIRAGSIDYLLKPVTSDDLFHALKKAIRCQQERQHLTRDSKNWKRVSKSVTERFFHEVMLDTSKESRKFLTVKAKQQGIPLKHPFLCVPLLFSIKKYSDCILRMDQHLLEFTMKNIAYETFSEVSGQIICTMVSEQSIVILLYDSIDWKNLALRCDSYLHAFSSYLGGKLCGYQGHEVSLENLSEELASMLVADKNNVSVIQRLLSPEYWNTPFVYSSAISFPHDEFIRMIKNMREDSAFFLLEHFLKRLERNAQLDGTILQKIQNDILQTVYVLLKEYNIEAHLLFEDTQSSKLLYHSLLSIDCFLQWSRHLLSKTCQIIPYSQNDQSLVAHAEQYIKKHLDTIIGCKEVAKEMYLTPDYLSRLFKEEKGITLQKYIQQEKIQKAKNLLASTNISISIIAQLTGYTHFSHFSMTFKKATGFSPVDYRKQYRKGGIYEN